MKVPLPAEAIGGRLDGSTVAATLCYLRWCLEVAALHLEYWWLIPVGCAVGAYGTLIGAGGGFVLVPFLVLLYPHESTAVITSISLAVVFFNALSGTIAYARMGRVHYKAGLTFSAATVPGAILGAVTTNYIPRTAFNLVLGIVLLAVSAFLILRPANAEHTGRDEHDSSTIGKTRSFDFDWHPKTGIVLSLFVGYASSVLGIGGGIIHVPALISLLGFPAHVATATSHFVLAVTAFAGTATHVVGGAFTRGVFRTIYLSIGIVVGAQFGALVSRRIHGKWIVRALAAALAAVAVRILVAAAGL